MASPELNKSDERQGSPGNHPMILRSACRLCCAAESTQSLPRLEGKAAHRREDVHQSHLNLNGLHFHHHHHHQHSKDSSVNKKYISQDATSAEAHISKTVASQLNSITQQEAITASEKNIAFTLSDSLHKSSLVEQISSINVASVARKLMSSSSVNFLSASMHKEVYSDYSSGEENEFHHGNEVNKILFQEDMSRTRSQTRIPLSSVRFMSASESSDESEERINSRSTFYGRHDGNLRTRSTHLVDSSVDDVGLSKVLSYSSGGRQLHGAASRNNHLYSVEGSPNNMAHSNEVLEENSFRSSTTSGHVPFPYSDSMLTMFRWVFWKCVYHNVCEVLLFDTWILSRCHTFGKKKILFALLLLIPLWLLGSYLTENYSSDLHSNIQAVKSATSWGSLFSYSFSSAWFTNKHQESDSLPVCSDHPETTQSMLSNMWNIFYGKEENSQESDFSSLEKSNMEISVQSTEISDEKIKLLALEVFKKESNQLMKQLEKKSNHDQVYVEQDMKTVLNEISLVTSQHQSLSDSLQVLKDEIREQLKSDTTANMQSHSQLVLLNSKLQSLEEKLKSFETLLASAKNCCKNQSDYLIADTHLTSLLMKLMEDHEDENHPIFAAFRSWLRSNFISRQNLSDEIASVIEHMYGNSLKLPKEHYENIAERVAESVVSKSMNSLKHDIINISKTTSSSSVTANHYAQGMFKMDDIQKIVKEAILLYDADKTGRVDYALESGGGSIISTRCSETYNAGTARLSIFGLPLWYASKSPRTAIQPEVQPGECWAFHGSQGFLVIQLSATIQPSGFSMEHIPKSLSPTGTIDSAPKEFSVWGLTSEKNDMGKLLGEFMYDGEGDPLQYFPVMTNNEDYYSVIELKIHSNWGNQKYTCLYRFRVHGTPL